MKKHNVESPQKSLPRISEMRLSTLRPKGTKSDYDGSCDVIVNGHTIFGLQVLSRKLVETLQRVTMDQRVEERVKSKSQSVID